MNLSRSSNQANASPLPGPVDKYDTKDLGSLGDLQPAASVQTYSKVKILEAIGVLTTFKKQVGGDENLCFSWVLVPLVFELARCLWDVSMFKSPVGFLAIVSTGFNLRPW